MNLRKEKEKKVCNTRLRGVAADHAANSRDANLLELSSNRESLPQESPMLLRRRAGGERRKTTRICRGYIMYMTLLHPLLQHTRAASRVSLMTTPCECISLHLHIAADTWCITATGLCSGGYANQRARPGSDSPSRLSSVPSEEKRDGQYRRMS